MRYKEAMRIIKNKKKPEVGFVVIFEKVMPGGLLSCHFPEHDEPLIKTEEEAWELAGKFASQTFGKYVNFYVADSLYFPVEGYRDRRIKNN